MSRVCRNRSSGVTAAGAYPSAGAGIRGVTRTSAGASGPARAGRRTPRELAATRVNAVDGPRIAVSHAADRDAIPDGELEGPVRFVLEPPAERHVEQDAVVGAHLPDAAGALHDHAVERTVEGGVGRAWGDRRFRHGVCPRISPSSVAFTVPSAMPPSW